MCAVEWWSGADLANLACCIKSVPWWRMVPKPEPEASESISTGPEVRADLMVLKAAEAPSVQRNASRLRRAANGAAMTS